jgi:thiol-disulfide isomerase/thioredoxin
MPSGVITRALDLMRLKRLGMITRQVSKTHTGHRLSAATVRNRGSGGHRYRKQGGSEYLHHASLLTAKPQGRLIVPAAHNPISSNDSQPINGPICQASKVGVTSVVRKKSTTFVLARLACAAVWLALASSGPARAVPEIGGPAPALVITALDGKTFDLAKLRGKVVLVNYWATWCAPCKKEMPKLDAFYRRYHSRGLEIISISIDFERDFEKARKVAHAVTYPVALAKAVSDDGFGIPKGVPITWIIDVDGQVRDRFIELRDELLDGIVVPLLPH